jgi:hypothetical protein
MRSEIPRGGRTRDPTGGREVRTQAAGKQGESGRSLARGSEGTQTGVEPRDDETTNH